MTKFLIAIDSFKESLSSKQIGDLLNDKLIQYKNGDIEIKKQIIADGGEGTVDTFLENIAFKKETVKVKDPLFREITSYYAYNPTDKVAIIEMALASGIELLTEEEKDTKMTSTYGVGQLINDAMQKGARKIIIGLGSSATTDGGIGMANALGAKFLDDSDNELEPIGANLAKISFIDQSELIDFNEIEIIIASDVTNPLFGLEGAAYVYSKQKGATPSEIAELDKGLRNLATLYDELINGKINEIPGSGAAGGLGAGLFTFTGAQIERGFNLIADAVDLEAQIKDADYVITGEGKFDSQTLNGKVPIEVCNLAKKHQKKCIAIFALVTDPKLALNSDFDAVYSTTNNLTTLEQAFQNTEINLELIAKSLAKQLT